MEKRPFEFLVKSVLQIEKLRVAAQVRQTHLGKQNRKDLETDELLARIRVLENYADNRLGKLLEEHPAYLWFSRVKGVGRENIAKVVGLVDIDRANTISSLWKFAGYHVENGKAPKRQKGGGKLSYNSRLRSMSWRLGSSLLRARGKFYDFYSQEKEKYIQKCSQKGIKIVSASQLPKDEKGKRYEPEGVISEGHIHNYALRKMIKLFLACLWLVWRERVGLPIRPSYPIEHLGHTTVIDPWEMVDRAMKSKKPII
ncbi:MAG: hypothetical protein QMC93_01045 [Patescibacteria group bacterium]|nr:hypothetical protein [Patescibacteria group bacterium]